MYLLFQQQTTLERAASDNDMWGPFSEDNPACLKAFSLLRMFGPSTCLVAPDSQAGGSFVRLSPPPPFAFPPLVLPLFLPPPVLVQVQVFTTCLVAPNPRVGQPCDWNPPPLNPWHPSPWALLPSCPCSPPAAGDPTNCCQ